MWVFFLPFLLHLWHLLETPSFSNASVAAICSVRANLLIIKSSAEMLCVSPGRMAMQQQSDFLSLARLRSSTANAMY